LLALAQHTASDDKIDEKEYEEQLKNLEKAAPKVNITTKNGLQILQIKGGTSQRTSPRFISPSMRKPFVLKKKEPSTRNVREKVKQIKTENHREIESQQ
jgi:hypothetical protein